MTLRVLLLVLLITGAVGERAFAQATVSEPLRAMIPRADVPPIIDGKLTEYSHALCAPVEYFNVDQKNRPAQFYYLWDDKAFYVGVRTLDERRFAPRDLFWTGDAVEWYFDTRAGNPSARRRWEPGAVHCFFSALDLDHVKPRFTLRPGYEHAISGEGVEIAGQSTSFGLEYEFKLPWSNFPGVKAAAGNKIHLDTELSYSDGDARSFRSFVFGSPLSVEQPANLAQAMLVDSFAKQHWTVCGPVMMPIRIDTSWSQESEPQVQASIALPPNRMEQIGKIEFQLLNTSGNVIAEFAAAGKSVLQQQGNFMTRTAHWPNTVAAPGAYHVQAIVHDQSGAELCRIAPRLVSVNMDQGY